MVCLFTSRHVTALHDLIGGETLAAIEAAEGVDLMDEAGRYRARGALQAALAAWIEPRCFAEVAAALDRTGALWGPYQSFAELAAEAARHPMFAPVEQPGIGVYPIAGAPFDIAELTRLEPKPSPHLGQHTDEILSGVLGMADIEIARLRDDKIVAGR